MAPRQFFAIATRLKVCDRQGVEWMLEDAQQAPLNIFLKCRARYRRQIPVWKLRVVTSRPQKLALSSMNGRKLWP